MMVVASDSVYNIWDEMKQPNYSSGTPFLTTLNFTKSQSSNEFTV